MLSEREEMDKSLDICIVIYLHNKIRVSWIFASNYIIENYTEKKDEWNQRNVVYWKRPIEYFFDPKKFSL